MVQNPTRRIVGEPVNGIGDYALIGDCHSAALVGRDGSIDWACFPRYDSPSVFARMLDERRGGAFRVAPERAREVARAYLDGTNVLVSTYTCETGRVEITDCMPVERSDPADPKSVSAHHAILRRIRCLEGEADVTVRIDPRFEYGSFVPRFRTAASNAAEIVGGADALYVQSTHPISCEAEAVEARWPMRAGEEAWIDAVWRVSYLAKIQHGDALRYRVEGQRRLNATIDFWRSWLTRCSYEGEHQEAVFRSALALKALTYAPSGAIVAAPTTSLPEWIGGARNWDYRYTWIRDATLTLTSLFVLGFTEEADAFKSWLERTGAGRPADLQIMYGVGGERSLPELELDMLEGHRGSSPVRIGNGAVKQMQLDAYGQILEAAYLYGKAGGELTQSNWRFLAGLTDIVCERWQHPDQGIWEIRDEPRHFVHSKLNCWIALDRAARIARAMGLPAPVDRWERERDAVRDYLFQQAAPDGWFHQAVGHPVPDAATLLVPSSGLIATSHPLAVDTIDAVVRSLSRDGLVYRYLSPDGLAGDEGAFLLCSFWLVDCLTYAGRLPEAEEMLGRLLGFANDVGLLAEEVDPATGEPLGNFPQAFSHMALVLSCAHLSAAKRGEIRDGPVDYAEAALDRLLARSRLSK
jgi:GH15 family glucan-1,4-alpha-glucosidase